MVWEQQTHRGDWVGCRGRERAALPPGGVWAQFKRFLVNVPLYLGLTCASPLFATGIAFTKMCLGLDWDVIRF